jgi:hypothetical protein
MVCLSAPSPLWRQAYDAADRAVAPRVTTIVRSARFARGLALTTRLRAVARTQAEGLSARVWHLVNLPAASDGARLRAQLGALDREVRRLAIRLDQQLVAPDDRSTRSEENADAEDSATAHGVRPRAPRRRAKRPADT